ncbi:MAG: dephospho-CoA kinase [Pseudomonadota bacterium]
MTISLGLTGSIGTGKSTTAQMFKAHGAAVWSADAAVHALYALGGAAVPKVQALFPGVVEDGAVNRRELSVILRADPNRLQDIEEIVHPLVALDRADTLENASEWLVIFEVPLLFEKGIDAEMDVTACTSVSVDVQKRRVLERPGVTEAQLDFILQHHWPSAKKCAASDYVIDTSTHQTAEKDVARIVRELREAS